MSRDGRRRAWREFSYYPEQEETEGLYSGLEISEYSDYGNGGNNSINANSDYASPVTEELLLSPLSQRSLEHCEELELDPGEREQRLLLFQVGGSPFTQSWRTAAWPGIDLMVGPGCNCVEWGCKTVAV